MTLPPTNGGIMGTTSTEIFDLFLANIKDYTIDAIYTSSGSSTLNSYLEPWLLFSIVEFEEVCDQSLAYTGTSVSIGEGYFEQSLSLRNKTILALLITKYWLKREIQNILQMRNHITDHDFKTFSAANNLHAKRVYYQSVNKELDTIMNRYGYDTNNWSGWKTQNFD
jgi:hypothetical protein